jgi:phosphorylcholine metabolism protein LicD
MIRGELMFSKFKKKNDKTPKYPTRKDFEGLEELVNNQHDLLNNIFVFHELELSPFLELMRKISYELLKFFDNVCTKHDIEYWLDFGTLLGAVRHEGFIPWDDDLDVGMLREDYYKFLEVFPKELENSGSKYVVAWFKEPSWDINSRRWYQINCKYPEFNGKFVGIDVFPYDYITEFDDDYISRFHDEIRPEFFKVWKGDVGLKDALDSTCGPLNLSLSQTDYFIGGVDGGRFKTTSVFKILETKDLRPVKRIKFGDYEFLAPNNPDNYLSEIYGKEYMRIGRTSKDHGRLNRYKKYPNIMEILNGVSEELISVNRNFK